MFSSGTSSRGRTRPDIAPWEKFCREEARRAAHEFLEKVRRLQTTERDSMEVPESVFASKFSAHFMDEVIDLTGSSVANGGLHSSGEFSRSGSSSGKKAGAGKGSWWNIFKRRQSREDRTSVLVGSSAANRNAGVVQQPNQLVRPAAVVLEAQVKMLDMRSCSGLQLSWQACRLVLTSEQGNHQLEIYCPSKSNFPKMSLFCFLLKEVRSSTTLELPDSLSSFVVKSDNHVEYVFDAGSEREKEKWITIIRSHSSRLCHQNPNANGHLENKTRSHSISGTEHNRLHKSHHALVSFPVRPRSDDTGTVPLDLPMDHSSSSAAATGRRSTTTGKSFSASPSPCRSGSLRHRDNTNSCSSPAPDRENTPSFFKCRPQRTNPNPRPRRTLSMYEHGSLACPSFPTSHSHSHSNPHSHSQTPPSPSPPLPKRSQRSLSSLSEIPTTPTSRSFAAAGVRNGWPIGSNPAIVTSSSSPHAGSVPVDNPFSSNLDSCSHNSSSSALHPVTLNAANAPQQQRSRNGRHSSVSSLNASPTSLPRQLSGGNARSQLSPSSSRKASSGNSPSGSANWTNDIEEEVRRAKQRFPSCDALSDTEPPSHTVFPALDCSSPGEVTRKKHDGSPSPPLTALPNLPSPAASPSVLRRFSPTLDSYREETDAAERESSEVIEVFPSRDQDVGVVGCGSPGPVPLPSRPRNMRFFSETHADDITQEPHTITTPSPSSGYSGASHTFEAHPAQDHNGIFIELPHSHRVPPGLPSSVAHPYASWAVTQQDAENLRQLVRFHWFHGMVSRANATQLVLADGEAGSGRYLVRQSESREGEFVLTFNYRGRAKHLRIVLDSSGCSVQHLFFSTVSSMLDYFKSNTIPLETSWNEDDCRITDSIDRSVSDSLRTITAIYSSDLLSSPRLPRRSHSLQLALTQAVASAMQQQNSGSPMGAGGIFPGRVRRGSSSLPHNVHQQTGGGGGAWRNIFRPSTLQRRHSEMADMHHAIDNNYVYRN